MIFIGVILVNVLFSYAILERDPNSIVYYGDAISHLVISREIFDSLSPGFGQTRHSMVTNDTSIALTICH